MQDEASIIGEVLKSKTCRKILAVLKKGPKTETETSEKLGIPLSTVHYNIEKMLKAGLIKVNSFHYSKKGKEIKHYQLVKKKKVRLFDKSISIILAIIAGISLTIWHFKNITTKSSSQLTEIAKNSYCSSAPETTKAINSTTQIINHTNRLIGILILIGIIALMLLFLWFKKKRS